MRAVVHEIKDLSWVEKLLEAAQEFDALVVTALGVDEDEERGAAPVLGGLPVAVGGHGVERRGGDDGESGVAQGALGGVVGLATGMDLWKQRVCMSTIKDLSIEFLGRRISQFIALSH